MKLLFFIGTRPEAIKIAPLYLAFKESFPESDIKLCLTGQHNEMLWQVMDVFQLKADYNLDVMTQGQDLYSLSSKLLLSIRDVLHSFNPDYVFVHGDTTTSFIASLASFYNKSKICHIEAGLRTYDLYSPFPEEANRSLTGRLANLHFAPSNLAKENLIREGIHESGVIVTGNTVIDALLLVSKWLKGKDNKELLANYSEIDFTKKIILITNHRRENLEFGIREVCEAVKLLSIKFTDIQFVFPVHMNPIIRKQVDEVLKDLENVHLLAPLNYLDFIFFMNHSYLIITDSGGIQEEAPILGKPVIVTRESTERPEAIKEGLTFITGPHATAIVNRVSQLIDDTAYYETIAKPSFVFGDGKASERIVDYFRNSIVS